MSKVYDFDKVIDRQGTNSDKWECMHFLDSRATPDTIPFWLADMDFECSEEIIQAIKERADRLIFGYGCPMSEMYEALSGWYRKRFNWDFSESDIHYSPGIVPAIGYLIDILTNPGDGVMIFTPVYYPFARTIQQHGRKVVNSPLINDGHGHCSMDLGHFEELAKDNRLLIFCSPHNPVGRVWNAEELNQLLDICEKYGTYIVADEIHNDIIRRGQTHYILETLRPSMRNRIITCVAPTKTFNLAGLQYSNIIIHDEKIRQDWNSYAKDICGVSRPNVLSIAAVQAAYQHGENWLEQVIDYLDGNMQMMKEYLKENLPESIFYIPEGTYLTWVDLSAYGFDTEMFGRFITEGKILLEDGSVFGAEGAGHVRINVACPRALLLEGLKRMTLVLKS